MSGKQIWKPKPPDISKNNGTMDVHDIWRFPVDQERKTQNLLNIRQAVRQKHIRRHLSFAEKAWNQLRFQTWQHWTVQGGILLAAMLLIAQFYEKNIHGLDSVTACSVFLVFAGNICFSNVARLFSRNMAELEKTLYLDLKQMVCIGMLEAGVFDLLVLGILAGCMGSRSENGILAYLLYLLVPFLWSEIFYLHMLSHVRNIFSGFRQLCFGTLCGALALFPVFWKNAYLPESVPVWGMLTAAGVLLLAAEIYGTFKKIDAGDGLCSNYI